MAFPVAEIGDDYREIFMETLLVNTLDWSLQDERLLEIRSRGHFNRTLPSMQREGQAVSSVGICALCEFVSPGSSQDAPG